MRLKRNMLDPLLITFPSFARLLKGNKVKLLGVAGLAGVALAYGMNP